MGKFEDTTTFSGKTYEHISSSEKVSQAKDMPQMASSKASWRVKKKPIPKDDSIFPYLDEEGNPIKEEVEKLLYEKENR